ncbi:MAG: AAA family ATPase [Bacteroides sp]|nr:AAA family ATPase [Bacteroides sp.]
MDDFEKLLDEFINSAFSDSAGVEDEGPEWLKFRNYTSNGVVYRIPVAPRKPQYRFKGVKVSYNKESVGTLSGGTTMMEPQDADEYLLMLHFLELFRECKSRRNKEVVVALYREGHGEPLSLVTCSCESDFRILWNSESEVLFPGRYFLLVVNAKPADDLISGFDVMGGCQRFSFQILPYDVNSDSPNSTISGCMEEQEEDELDTFHESMAELNAMVGLTELKKSLMTTLNRTRFEEKRRQWGLPVPDSGGHHMIFTGNPGTGKTTVAKMIGRIFHALGLLSKGEVIEAERTTMVGRYIGETEQKMEELLERAKGNVLFIDEAYSLCDNSEGDRKDFGCRVLESLLTVLTRKNPDILIIMAGYEKEIRQMLEMNPGMKGRFPYKFHFDDYNADELFQIACNKLKREEYVLTSESEAYLKETIAETVAQKDAFFHNARWVEQYIQDGIVSAMSDRVMSLQQREETREMFQTIELVDVQIAYRKMGPQLAEVQLPRRRIGFVA